MREINIQGRNFYDNSTAVRNITGSDLPPASVDFDCIIRELREIKSCLIEGTADYEVVSQLEKSAAGRSWKKLFEAASKFIGPFTSATLANLTGTYLAGLLRL